MAERVKYYTTAAEEEKIPELQEIASTAAQPTPEAAAPAPVTPAPSFSSGAGQQQSALFQQIAERGPFQYDPSNDPLYKVARDRYVQQGRMAMKDSMGQAAALTGGYGSSYGQAVGQQTYDKNLQGLADMIPELYQAAYSRYQDEGDRLQRQYQLLGEQEARDYSRYRDQMGDWQYDRAWQQEKENADYARRNEAYTRLYTLIGATGYVPTAEEMEAAGMSKEQAEALRNEYLRQTGQLPATTGGGGDWPTVPRQDPDTTPKTTGEGDPTIADRIRQLRGYGFTQDEAWEFLGEEGVKPIEKPSDKKKTVVKPGTGGGGGKRVGNNK